MTFRLLILGGSSEGFALAEELAGEPGLETITSFAGRTKTRRTAPGSFRVGGFGGPEGLADYLAAKNIDALIDATHPFADRIKANAGLAAARTHTPLLHILRPAWQPVPGDDWREAADMEAAARMVPEDAGLVLLTVGRTELAPFAARPAIRFLARIIDPPEDRAALANMELLLDRGPFALEDERALFRERQIGCLVSKNSGGEAAAAKLTAARELGLPVIMVARPAPPPGAKVGSVAEALVWLREVRHGQG